MIIHVQFGRFSERVRNLSVCVFPKSRSYFIFSHLESGPTDGRFLMYFRSFSCGPARLGTHFLPWFPPALFSSVYF